MSMLNKIKNSRVDTKLERRHNKELDRITHKLTKLHAHYGMEEYKPIR